MKLSGISWTDFSGQSLNFVVRGSTKGDCECSPGCKECYVKALDDRFHFLPEHTTTHPDKLARLAKKRFPKYSPKRGAPHKPMCFVVDTGDLFHEDVPDKFIWGVLGIMEERDDVTWQILTKRAERMRQVVCLYRNGAFLPQHIWLGVSVENQECADKRIPPLLDTPAAVRFVSVEPMLGAVDLRGNDEGLWWPWAETILQGESFDWVICGAESGSKRRPFDIEWAVDLYEQCKAVGIPYFFKQGSALRPGMSDELPGYGEVKEWPI